MAGTKMVSPGSKITSMTFTPGRLDALMSFNGRKIPSMLGKGHDIFRRKGEGQWGTGHKWSVYSLYRHTSRKRRICFSKNSREKAEHGLYLHQIAMGTAGVLKGATQKARLIVIKWWRTMHLFKSPTTGGDSKSWLPKPMATNPVCWKPNLDQETVGLVAQERWYIPGSKESEAFSSRDLREPCVS